MYIPDEFNVKDLKKIISFINDNNFGLLLSIHDGEIYNTQIPLLLAYENDKIILKGHMARKNKQWIYAKNNRVTVLFQGPHHYISPLYYNDKESVPTWDYVTARVDSVMEMLDKEETELFLMDLSKYFDTEWFKEENYRKDYYKKMVNEIVAFKINATSVKAKYKLNQNKGIDDMRSVSMNLSKLNNENSKLISAYINDILSSE